MITTLPLITTRIAEPLDVTFYLNATAAEWDAMMQARYGPDWELDDELEQSNG